MSNKIRALLITFGIFGFTGFVLFATAPGAPQWAAAVLVGIIMLMVFIGIAAAIYANLEEGTQ